jgi:hypothetical protein
MRPVFVGGCTIAGFPKGDTWEFWYPTWGNAEYRRPKIGILQALLTGHWEYLDKKAPTKLNAVTYATMKVVDCPRIL